ncbi:hypothetical protein EC957_001061 [Mortierella hygrophila]|uniref:GST N-terminal domain-containing protein n=1 Tax=Mortierella hygrophila TaxID=979708 RepID=A0A9P6F604_9FUNG|nr:hypothetical protein EC957_001061 [Mortierella hygrophila]
MIEATKNLSTAAMSKILEGKNNEYSLLYFPFHGVVPALRAMLAMSGAKVTFTQPDDWPVEKKETQFGHMPILYETDPTTNQTLSLTELSVLEEYIGRKYNFLGSNSYEANQILAYNSSTQSLFDKFVTLVVRTADPDLRAKMMETFVNGFIGEWAEFHERALQANVAAGIAKMGHYVGEEVSLADLKTAAAAMVMMKVSGDKFISEEKTPAMIEVCKAVGADERYKKWNASEDMKLFNEVTKKRFSL